MTRGEFPPPPPEISSPPGTEAVRPAEFRVPPEAPQTAYPEFPPPEGSGPSAARPRKKRSLAMLLLAASLLGAASLTGAAGKTAAQVSPSSVPASAQATDALAGQPDRALLCAGRWTAGAENPGTAQRAAFSLTFAADGTGTLTLSAQGSAGTARAFVWTLSDAGAVRLKFSRPLPGGGSGAGSSGQDTLTCTLLRTDAGVRLSLPEAPFAGGPLTFSCPALPDP